ncbi:MAG: response regulator [Gemmatimonadetes bacterium]|nr:response regulator [Gemmatimonadota bacterium]
MPRRILIVEDEEALAKSFDEFITFMGYDVTVAANGYDALEKVIGGEFDLITMDIKMPRMGGLEATELIRFRYDISTPIIVISGYDDKYEKELRTLRVKHILHKPVDLTELKETIEKILGNDREEQEDVEPDS